MRGRATAVNCSLPLRGAGGFQISSGVEDSLEVRTLAQAVVVAQ